MDILGLIDKRASIDGSPEYNLKDAVYENLSMDQIEMFEFGLSLALNVMLAYAPSGHILKVMDTMSDVTSKMEIAQQSLDYERLGTDSKNFAYVMAPSATTEEESKIIIAGIRSRMSLETIQKTLKETFGTDYKLSPNDAFPITPLISEVTMVSGDENGKGMFTLVNSLNAEFGATILLRNFYTMIKNIDVTNAEQLQALTDAWSTIRGVAEEVAALEEYGIQKALAAIFSDSTTVGAVSDGQLTVAQIAALLGVGLLIVFGFFAFIATCACSGGDDNDDDDDDDD